MEGTTMSGSPSTARPADPSGIPEAVLAGIEAHLRQRELRREEIYQRARRLRRLAQGTMGRLHEGGTVTAELAEIKRSTSELAGWLQREGRGDEAIAHDAFQESVEATLLGAVVSRQALPGPQELGVEPESYLLGVGDLVGEIRRLTLDRLAQGELNQADRYLALMDSIYRSLLRFDTTRAIVQLKPKQDTARALLERTRGEVTMARLLARANLSTATGPGEPP
jgi:translin